MPNLEWWTIKLTTSQLAGGSGGSVCILTIFGLLCVVLSILLSAFSYKLNQYSVKLHRLSLLYTQDN